ncbi:hypothetical protein DUNSADRAFT_14547 [Dunaliella salina]|uniref:Encoded protein n=1 Tax=Dunaliella salina TaxID=3046 RepID=A0ABQ7G7B9_DUNSA|nr:hypothetical protein DUNSADRAFT_14547 [Dunaliella salina]|eukprot:KAF5830466.1 hypothetical protein DUNSADRAFT_14547 [Dunaliella salina]
MATQLLAKQQRLEAAQAAADLAVEQLELKTRQLTPTAAQHPTHEVIPSPPRPPVPRSSLSSHSLTSAKSSEGHPNGTASMSSEMRDLSVHARLSSSEGHPNGMSPEMRDLSVHARLSVPGSAIFHNLMCGMAHSRVRDAQVAQPACPQRCVTSVCMRG